MQSAFAIRYIIVDDEEISRLSVEAEASKYPFLSKAAVFSHALEASEFINQAKPDVVFADIEMPGMSGLELIRKSFGQIAAPVFITSHPEFALESYESYAFDYLLKPLNEERFSRCAFRLKEFFELRDHAFAFAREQESKTIVIRQGYDKYKLTIPDILYLEAMKDYTKIVSLAGKYLVLEPISSMLLRLPHEDFIRVHRSYVINKNKLISVRKNKAVLANIELPIGKMFKHVLDEMFD